MESLIALPGVVVTGIEETFQTTTCIVTVAGPRPPCPRCQSALTLIGHGTLSVKVRDTPMHGRPTVLELKRRRFKCICGGTCIDPMPGFIEEDSPRITKRLSRYIENQTLRHPISRVATEVGVRNAGVQVLALRLAKRLLKNHRFPTPTVLGIDDLHFRDKIFTVVTDGQTGHAIALVEGGTYEDVRDELKSRGIDKAKVKFVVSDLGTTNIAVVRHFFDGKPVHIADKWHILKGVQEALSLVINKEIDFQRRRRAKMEKYLIKKGLVTGRKTKKRSPRAKSGVHPLDKRQAKINRLREAKKHLMGMKIKDAPNGQYSLDPKLMLVEPTLKDYPKIRRAFWAKIRLYKVYGMKYPTRAKAEIEIDRFISRASSPSIVDQMAVIIARVQTHRNLILNYFDNLTPKGNGFFTGLTNGPTERRNGSIRAAWRSSRGIRSKEILTMRALYEPWHLDVDIALCGVSPCQVVEGPFPGQATSRRARATSSDHIHRCAGLHP